MGFRFNPLTGNLDLVGSAAPSAGSSGVVGAPTVVRAGDTFVVPADTQLLVALPVELEAGASIELGENSVQVSVT